MSAATSIIAAIDALNVEIKSHQDEIDRLTIARDALGGLVSTEEGKAIRGKSHRPVGEPIVESPVKGAIDVDDDDAEELANEVPVKKSTRKQGGRKMTSAEAGEAFVKSAVKQATRKGGNAPKSTTRKATIKVATPKGNGKVTRRDQIIALLNKGQSPRQIGDKLGIAPNYVYHVKRDLS
jgi:hypothetical protein